MPELSKPIYTRLPGRSLTPLAHATLWLGEDHLLYVHSRGHLVEQYKRYRFKDIQAILIQQNNHRAIRNMYLVLMMAFSAQLLMWETGVPFLILALPTLCFVVLLAINSLRGPTCTCRLITAVSNQDLLSLDRVAAAQRVLQQILLHIEDAQDTVPEYELRRQLAAAAHPPGMFDVSTDAGRPAGQQPRGSS